jgi:hypothetical protein
MPPLTWRRRYYEFPQVAYPATLAPRCLPISIWRHGGWRLGCLVGCGTRRSGWYGGGLHYPFPYNARRSCARGFPRRCSDGPDHVRTASDRNDHNWFPPAWCTGQRRQRQRTHVVVSGRFSVGTLGRRVRFPRSHRVRTPHSCGVSDAPSEMPDGGSRRLRSRSPIKQRAHYSVLLWSALARTPLFALSTDIFQSYKPTSVSASTCFASPAFPPQLSNRARPESRRLNLVSATAPLRLWLRTSSIQRAAKASSVTSSLSTSTPSSASQSVAPWVYHHPASSPPYAPPLLVLRPDLASLGSRYAGCIRIGGCWHVG